MYCHPIETIKGGRGVEEEEYDIALTVRRSALRHKVQPQEVVVQTYKILSRLSGLRNLIPDMVWITGDLMPSSTHKSLQ